MTFEELMEVNKTLKGTDIKGKDYVMVNQRVLAFRQLYPEGFIKTTLLSDEGGKCVFRTIVGEYKDGQEVIYATGYAYEKEGSTFINKTSYLENCETSSIGRALAMLGIGIDTSVASYEEVANARLNQEEEDNNKKFITFVELINKLGTYEIDRHAKEFLEYVNSKANTNYTTLDPDKVSYDDMPKLSRILKAILKAKGKEMTTLDVKDETPTF